MRDAARYLAHVVVVVVSLCRRYLPQPSHQEAIQLDGSRVESTLDRWHLADTTTRCARQQAASGQQQKASRPRRGRRLLLVAWLRRACVRHIGIGIGIGMARVALVASVTTGIEFVAEEELRARLAPRGGDAAAALQLARHPGKVSLSLPASEVRGGGNSGGGSGLTETVCASSTRCSRCGRSRSCTRSWRTRPSCWRPAPSRRRRRRPRPRATASAASTRRPPTTARSLARPRTTMLLLRLPPLNPTSSSPSHRRRRRASAFPRATSSEPTSNAYARR